MAIAWPCPWVKYRCWCASSFPKLILNNFNSPRIILLLSHAIYKRSRPNFDSWKAKHLFLSVLYSAWNPWCCSLWTYWHLLVASETLLQGKEFMYKRWASARDTLSLYVMMLPECDPALSFSTDPYIYTYTCIGPGHWCEHTLLEEQFCSCQNAFLKSWLNQDKRQLTESHVKCKLQLIPFATKNLIFSRKELLTKFILGVWSFILVLLLGGSRYKWNSWCVVGILLLLFQYTWNTFCIPERCPVFSFCIAQSKVLSEL